MKKSFIVLLVSAVAATSAFSMTVSAATGTSSSADRVEVGSSASMSDGEIKKVDKDAGKITIKHGPLVNLEMPGMTMVFRVKEAGMLDRIKAGDKVKFTAEKLNGALTITSIETGK